jgi:vitamin B12 transporter
MSIAHLTRRALTLAPFLLAPLAAAQTSTPAIPTLENIVVTPSRMAQPKADALGDVTVIGKHELEQAGQSSVAAILARQPGVQFYDNGGSQTVTGVYLRGANPAQTLVLIDGMRVNSAVTGAVNWPALDPASIERIEVLRGAASSLYGSDAIGGVINIITDAASGADRPLSAWANIGAGSQGTFKTSAGFSGAQDGWNYALAGNLSRSSGFNGTSADNFAFYPDRDGYRRQGLNASLGYRWKPGQHIGLTAYNSLMRADVDVGALAPDAYLLTRQQAYTVTSSNRISEMWHSTLRLGLSKEAIEDRSFATLLSTLQRSYSWQNDVRLSASHHLSAVLERLEERTAHSSGYTRNQRDTNAAGLIYRGDFGAHHVQANVRNDNISSYGNQLTGGLAYDLELSEHWKAGASANTGFRAPTFSDMYYPFDGFFHGNPDLKPEKSRNLEARLVYETPATRLGLTVFQNKVRDLINPYVCDANFDCTAMNTERATLRGVTLSGEHAFKDTALRASADFLDPRNDRPRAGETGSRLAQRARQVYRLAVEQRFDELTAGAEFQFTGRRYSDAANQIRLGGYGVFNLTLAYAFSKNAQVQARWNNVFNKEYSSVYGYRHAGSNVFVNLALKM